MTINLIKRYIWLIDTINQAGFEGITFKEITNRWQRQYSLSGGEDYKWRTFMNHKNDISELFGIKIACRKSTNSYYIADREDLKKVSGIKHWMLEALSLSNLLNESMQLKNRIILEENPSGRELLPIIFEAMRDSKMLTFNYKPFWVEDDYVAPHYNVEPYAVKLFKRRWYLLAKYGESPLKIYALDRISELDIEFKTFTLPEDFDAEEFFSTCFGIIVSDEEPEHIEIKVDDFQANYLRTLPLHHSQKEVVRTEQYTIFRFFLRPTFDFIQELLSLGNTTEILSPAHLRAEIAHIGKTMAKLNGKKRG